jgi:hypothetical protein
MPTPILARGNGKSAFPRTPSNLIAITSSLDKTVGPNMLFYQGLPPASHPVDSSLSSASFTLVVRKE